jgi:glycosyltransferase involved in cell wall biosynthesis
LAQPSTKEGFGLVLLEALACDLPVVASDLAVFRTFLEHGRNALLVPVGDAEALADALARLARDPAERARLRSGGRAVIAEYSWDAAAESYELAYRALLPSLPRSRAIAPAATGP